MSQNEIYSILKNKRLSGDDRFFSQAQITSLILDGKISNDLVGSHTSQCVNRDLNRLHSFGLLEKCSVKGISHYRLKKKLIEE